MARHIDSGAARGAKLGTVPMDPHTFAKNAVRALHYEKETPWILRAYKANPTMQWKELHQIEEEERWQKRHPQALKAKEAYVKSKTRAMIVLLILGLLLQLLQRI
jgi:hypothetical protein